MEKIDLAIALLAFNVLLTWTLINKLTAIFRMGERGRWPKPYEPPKQPLDA